MVRGIAVPNQSRKTRGDFQLMTIYQHIPYTYLIGWTSCNMWYYGVRYSKDCNPDDLWISYFTSSKYVAELRDEIGEPDIIQIRKTFDCPSKAIKWESKVLKRMALHKDDRFINKSAFPAMNPIIIIESNKKRILSLETINKMRNSQKSRKISAEHRLKISIAHKGKPKKGTSMGLKGVPKTEEHRRKIAESNRGKPFSEERKNNISKARKGHKPSKVCCIICKCGKEYDPGNFTKHFAKIHPHF